ncbi:DUF3300 domain-containing protein [Chromatiaceae bacterium AAb-1]|nr:DUF3300 domain-containing protein [Chromatiaceae bacterium AAb-1]
MKNLNRTFRHIIMILLLSVTGSPLVSADELNQAELDQMLAPVALYPDTVLTHLLIAATYPLEVVQAARWSEKNPDLSGDEAVRAAEKEDWDPSVKTLLAFPQLLKRMNDDLSWTQQLGEAFLTDETQVLASIQQLRQKAYDNGALNKLEHVVVEREKEVIVIEPARREVIYVPYYDTRVVYGNWWWPAYPPVYWHYPAAHYSGISFYWGPSVIVRPSFYFGIFDWNHRHIIVNHHYYYNPPRYYPRRHHHYSEARHWQHNTWHRRGVHYQHDQLNHRYQNGYSHRTREIRPANAVNRTVEYRRTETRPTYERRTAEQIRIPQQRNDRNVTSTEQIRQRQQRDDRSNITRTEQIQQRQQRDDRSNVISTEQVRQRQQRDVQQQVSPSQPREAATPRQYTREPQRERERPSEQVRERRSEAVVQPRTPERQPAVQVQPQQRPQVQAPPTQTQSREFRQQQPQPAARNPQPSVQVQPQQRPQVQAPPTQTQSREFRQQSQPAARNPQQAREYRQPQQQRQQRQQ